MRRTTWRGFAIVLVPVIIAAALFGSPYYVLMRAKQAADARDAQALSVYVDYPAVRESLKTNLHDALGKEMDKRRDNPFGALALAFGSWVSDRVVEALLTPEAVAAMLRGDSTGLPPVPGAPAPRMEDAPAAPPQPRSPAPATSPAPADSAANVPDVPPRTVTTTAFQDFNHFLVYVHRSNRPDRVVTFTLSRRNLVQWRLTAIQLPAM
ncbi:hypothetical protein PTE30175_04991 [Pandoraea terrae]|uniref:DUF2939 domain-containing protein n=1 Tax=Pandoraea terrae TaxID=1537710 RepID=A0A5E4Z5C8_9BURK|nr:DUF2939 domain-containing protein [Pandoraea terrae]VVE56431.1 hypothetical protein PTE30175_04991 [Pandoraea terrae]